MKAASPSRRPPPPLLQTRPACLRNQTRPPRQWTPPPPWLQVPLALPGLPSALPAFGGVSLGEELAGANCAAHGGLPLPLRGPLCTLILTAQPRQLV